MWISIDRVLRFLYCAAVPMFVVAFAVIAPVGGVIVGAVLAIAVALVGPERWRAWTARVPLVGRIVGNMARLGEFYRETPPRPLVYYVVFPLLLPYVVFSKRARTEYRLYRRLNVVALLILVAGNAYDFFAHWRPELAFGQFARIALATLILQVLITTALIMPLVTTLVVYKHERHRKALVALAVIGVLTTAFMVAFSLARDKIPGPTESRMILRAEAAPERAHAALAAALHDGIAALPAGARDGFQAGAPLDQVHAALRALWKRDEANAFHFGWDARTRTGVVFRRFRKHAPLWLAQDASGRVIDKLEQLPPAVQTTLRAQER